jgi:hypothetical protein
MSALIAPYPASSLISPSYAASQEFEGLLANRALVMRARSDLYSNFPLLFKLAKQLKWDTLPEQLPPVLRRIALAATQPTGQPDGPPAPEQIRPLDEGIEDRHVFMPGYKLRRCVMSWDRMINDYGWPVVVCSHCDSECLTIP